jgi:DNA polymerase-3 subunit epsilon
MASKRTSKVSVQNSLFAGLPTDIPLSIVDVETTGQSAAYGRLIEVAVIRLESGNVVKTFESLVNPERFISPVIEGLTGISNGDVAEAPKFSEIARKLYKILDGAVFVAHNARFDYSFIKSEFGALGIPFTAKCLCTVRLSRKLFSEHRRHDLSSLIERHGLPCDSRHRAMGDAKAVLEFLRHIGREIDAPHLEKAFQDILKSSSLPAGVEKTMLDGLPEAPGVYLFHGKGGELLYVGKSVNIRDRVRSHFASDGTSAKEMAMCQQIQRVEHRETAGELGALLLESQLIKELRPIYNSMARRKRNLIVARRHIDRRGYHAVALEEIDHIEPEQATSIMAVFKHVKQAQEYLSMAAKTYQLCNKLLGLEQTRSYCFSYHLRQCKGACVGEEAPETYNFRVEEAFGDRRVRSWPYEGGIAIEERSGRGTRGEVFLVDNWCLVSSFKYTEFGMQEYIVGSHRFDYDSYKILSRYVLNDSHRRNIRHLGREQFEELLARCQ